MKISETLSLSLSFSFFLSLPLPLSVSLSQFVTLCNNFLSHFIIKTRITKNLDIIQIFVAHSFQECQESRGPLLIDDFIVTRLFWKFWLFNNPLSKNIIRMFTSNFFYYLKHQYFVNQSTQSTPLLSKFRPKKTKFSV